MEFISEALSLYCENHREAQSVLLQELNRETHLKVLSPRMLSGHLQERYLSFISQLKQPKHILEIGTYTGYSALCLAQGLQEEGILITIDPNEETNAVAKRYFDKSAYKNKIQLMQGQAGEIIPQLKQEFDIVFIDADKRNYPLYFDLVIDKDNYSFYPKKSYTDNDVTEYMWAIPFRLTDNSFAVCWTMFRVT